MKKIYITTPIYYVNDLPHIGHAYTSVICDSIARFYKLHGFGVNFTTGTDEHGLKVEQAARKNKKSPKDFVDDVSLNFLELTKKLQLSNNDFIRTTEKRHHLATSHFWKNLEKNNQIYLDKYSGWYSVKDEAYYQEKELIKDKDGNFVTIDGGRVDWVEEESYFFKLSKWQEKLLDYYDKNKNFVYPESRYNEVKSFVRSGLKDLSISRTSFSWGIKVPDTNHVMYVWVDALVNYLTSLGYPDFEKQKEYWQNSYHIIGKDILKFHAVYWPALLLANNINLPKRIIAHGWWTNEGKKISKSIGNTIDPNEMIDKYGLDQFRYFLIREIPLGNDGDFSKEAFLNRINSDLSNNLGNLIQRVMKFIYKNYDNRLPSKIDSTLDGYNLIKDGYDLLPFIDKKIENFEISKCLEEIFIYIDKLNKFVDSNEPWKVFKVEKEKAGNGLSILVETFRIVGILLQPFIPNFSTNLLDLLNIDKNEREFKFLNIENLLKKDHIFNKPEALFPRYEK